MALLHRQVGRASSHPGLNVSLTGTGTDVEDVLWEKEMLSARESILSGRNAREGMAKVSSAAELQWVAAHGLLSRSVSVTSQRYVLFRLQRSRRLSTEFTRTGEKPIVPAL